MSLTNDEVAKLEFILQASDDIRRDLSNWERTFLDDQQKRYDEHGANIRLSEKQWAALDRIAEKI